jgi:hypothetical protein
LLRFARNDADGVRRLLRLTRKGDVGTVRATKQPAGQITKTLSSGFAKNIPLNASGKSLI